jgi:hypothetical protein
MELASVIQLTQELIVHCSLAPTNVLEEVIAITVLATAQVEQRVLTVDSSRA